MEDKPKPENARCPRCVKPMPKYAALSRSDNKTYVCELCGVEEAIECHIIGLCSPQSDWPVSHSVAKNLMLKIKR